MVTATNAEKPLRILLVEDNEIIGNALRDHVAASGLTVDWLANLQSALLAVEGGDYALILLDLHLPDGSGLDLLKRLGERLECIPVIILSAYDQVSDRLVALELGAIDYLVKPFDLSEMITRIETFIEDRKASLNTARQKRLRVA